MARLKSSLICPSCCCNNCCVCRLRPCESASMRSIMPRNSVKRLVSTASAKSFCAFISLLCWRISSSAVACAATAYAANTTQAANNKPSITKPSGPCVCITPKLSATGRASSPQFSAIKAAAKAAKTNSITLRTRIQAPKKANSERIMHKCRCSKLYARLPANSRAAAYVSPALLLACCWFFRRFFCLLACQSLQAHGLALQSGGKLAYLSYF